MPDTDGSLLAHLAAKLTDRTETLATEALGHILSRSEKARAAVADLLRSGGAEVRSIVRVATEVTYENGGIRPDLVAYASDDSESVIAEVKFWARLAENQAACYFELLPHDRSSTLLIVGPELRRESLWAEIQRQLEPDAPSRQEVANGVWSLPMTHRRWVMLTSWRVLLDAVAETAEDVRGDVRQLQALCEKEDGRAFLPIRPDELASEIGRRMRDLRRLVDDATARGKREGFLDATGLRVTPQAPGYGTYLRIGTSQCAGVWLGVHSDHWADHRETPVWLVVYPWRDTLSREQVRERTGRMAAGTSAIPIWLRTGVEYAEVLDHVVEQLREISDLIAQP